MGQRPPASSGQELRPMPPKGQQVCHLFLVISLSVHKVNTLLVLCLVSVDIQIQICRPLRYSEFVRTVKEHSIIQLLQIIGDNYTVIKKTGHSRGPTVRPSDATAALLVSGQKQLIISGSRRGSPGERQNFSVQVKLFERTPVGSKEPH